MLYRKLDVDTAEVGILMYLGTILIRYFLNVTAVC